MRITNNMISNNYLVALNRSLERQSEIEEKLSDGKDLHRPSDDPVRVMRSLRFNTNVSINEQFTQNVKDASSWMENTDNAMNDINSIMTRAKELTIKAISTGTDSSFKAIGEEIDGLINHLVNLGNSKIGDRYLFAGQMDKTEPFVRDGDTFKYLGDDQKISMIIQPGATTPSRDSVNLTGKEVFGSSLELLRHLTEIKNELKTGNPNMSWLSNTGLGYIENDSERVLQQHTEIGSRMSMYNLAGNMLEANNVVITTDLANNEDLDIPKAVIESKTSEAVYRAALAVGAKIMPPSLVDFLR